MNLCKLVNELFTWLLFPEDHMELEIIIHQKELQLFTRVS